MSKSFISEVKGLAAAADNRTTVITI